MDQDDYLGDADEADWLYSGYVEDFDDTVLVAMPNGTTGTVISSTRFVWYGRIKSTFKTSRGAGVITAFILFSNVQDEIDWEFVGYNLTDAETNFYYQGVLNYTNVRDIDASDTFENYHTYEVDWREDRVDWYLDDQLVRTLNKADTWNETTQSYHFPQTPSRVQFSLWPGGSSQNAVGTIEWAGGSVDWDSEDIKDYGYYYVRLANASIECYDPPAGTTIDGNTSYIFNSTGKYDQEFVMISNNGTVLSSGNDSGLDANESSSSSSGSSSSSKTSSSNTKTQTTGTSKTTGTGAATTTNAANGNNGEATTTSSTYTYTGFMQFADSTTANVSGASSSNGGVGVAAGSFLSLLAGFLSYLLI